MPGRHIYRVIAGAEGEIGRRVSGGGEGDNPLRGRREGRRYEGTRFRQ